MERGAALMKHIRFILFLCVLTLLTGTTLDAAPKPKRGVQVTPKSAPALDSLYQNSYAVIIGVNAYDKWPSLEYAVKDARAMTEKLKSLGFQTTILLDQHATKDNILKILGDDLPQKVQKNDRVVIFFAGHGQTEEMADGTQMGYIVPVDADTRNIFSTAISMDQVRVFSRRLRAKHVLYLIDSCYAGLGLTRSGTIPPSERDYLRKITTRKAHQMLTAGGKGERAHEEGGHGVFTKYVLEALDGAADRDERGFITFSDMASYVKPKVSRYTGTKQIPQYGSIDGEGEFVFVLAGLPAAVQPAPSGLVNERQRLTEEKERLEEEKRSLAAQQAQMEEQKRLAEERRLLEEEKKRIAEEQASLREEKEDKNAKTRGWMGISVRDVTEDIAKGLKLSQRGGAMIYEVFKGAPADKAGLRPGDLIIEVNGKGIKDTHALLILLASFHVNEKVQVKALRDGQKRTYQVSMSAMSKRPATPMVSEIGRDERFIAYSDGTVLDTLTNLMWAARDNGYNTNWKTAKSYCESYRGGGYTDWRMPTMAEMLKLNYRSSIKGNVVNRLTPLITSSSCHFWVSTKDALPGPTTVVSFCDISPRSDSIFKKMDAADKRVLPVRYTIPMVTESKDQVEEKKVTEIQVIKKVKRAKTAIIKP
jgi:uncharacterized caspase-like protein